MDDTTDATGATGEPSRPSDAPASRDPSTESPATDYIVVDGKVYDVEPYAPGVNVTDEETYKKNRNRLSIARFPVGEEPWPDVPGTDKREPWVNVKLDVTEHKLEPDQKHLLGGGPLLKMKCHVCHEPLRAAAEKKPREVLEEGGFDLGVHEVPEEAVVACVCPAGHVTQLRSSFVRRLIADV